MKSHEVAEKGRNHNYGFIDPYQINDHKVKNYLEHTERKLLQFLVTQEYRSKILFPYNFG